MKNKNASLFTATALTLVLTAQTAGGATITQDEAALLDGQDGFAQTLHNLEAMGAHAMLGDQAPESAWSVNPVKSPDGSVACIGALTLNFDDARITDQSGRELSAEEKSELRRNTAYIKVVESGPTFDAFVKTGFGADDGKTNVTIDNLSTPIAQITNDGIQILDDVAVTEAQDIVITSTSNAAEPHTVEYTVAESFPLSAFVDCNNKAFNGEFDAAFEAISGNTVMVIDLPQDEAAQTALKEQFTAGGLCTAGFKPEEYGDIEYSRTWLPASVAGITRNEQGVFDGIAVGDLLRGSAKRLARSSSLTGSPFAASEISGCAGQGKPICIETDEDAGKLTISFCQATPALYTPAPVTPAPTYVEFLPPTRTGIVIPPGGDTPDPDTNPDPDICLIDCGPDPEPCLIGCNPDPDPEPCIVNCNPNPATVPVPAGIVLLGSAIAVFGGVAAIRNRRRGTVNPAAGIQIQTLDR